VTLVSVATGYGVWCVSSAAAELTDRVSPQASTVPALTADVWSSPAATWVTPLSKADRLNRLRTTATGRPPVSGPP
jgi:hypothetical protein